MLKFEKVIKQTRILSPLKNFEEDALTFEYRTDPLTGRNTTVIKGMIDYVGKFLTSDWELVNALVEKTKATCPFCPEKVKTKTPMFPKDFIPEGRIFFGDAVVVPNLLGHAEQSVLAILSKEHYLRLRDFTPKMFFDGFKGGAEYLKRLCQKAPSTRFPVFIINYLTPAGSSIFHPHMQVLARDRPFYLVKLLIEKSKAYYENNGASYWQNLMAEERGGLRHLFEINDVEWLVPFAPLRGLNEAQAMVNGKSNLLELSDKEWLGLAEGLTKILRFYDKEGYVSFNVIITSGPMDEHLDYFDVNLRIISRPGIQSLSFTDAWALPYLLWDGEAVEEPEKFAEKLKAFLEEK
jgi:galactose-1-phosphate uridylyltransferase